jgi:hypothetical protein
MNSYDDIIIDKNELNDVSNLKKRINDMNTWIDHLDEENHCYRRRLWMYFEYMVDLAHVMNRIMTEFGDDNIKRLIDQYFDNDRQDILRKERQLARSAELSFDFVDLDRLFSIKL